MVNDKPEMESSEGLLWLEKEIVPKIVEALGKDASNLQCEIKPLSCDSFFISTIYMVELIFSSGGGKLGERVRLIVKVPPKDETTRAYLRTHILFHNEITFYQQFGKDYTDYPKCVLTISESISDAVIILENVTQLGYKSVQPKMDIGMKRILTAVREIGKLHARGYVLKEKKTEKFFRVVDELRLTYGDSAHTAMIEYVNAISLRPVNYLRSVNFDPEFCDRISIPLSNAYEKILMDCMKPRNELAVLCHGDFTSNNILFREDGAEFKAMLIDFAQLRYSSPATDLSTFLYLSCEDEVRKNFPVIFKAYHDTVLEHLKEQGIQDLEKYSFDAFLKDYKRHAVIGCVIAIYFMPVTHFDRLVGFDEFSENKSECFENMMASGGDALSKRLADMLLELKDHGCLDHIP